MSTPVADPWIGVAHVAEELAITERAAWELVRRLGVPMLEPDRGSRKAARFRLSEWEAHRDAQTKPPTPRAPRQAPAKAAPTTRPKAKTASKLARLRGA